MEKVYVVVGWYDDDDVADTPICTFSTQEKAQAWVDDHKDICNMEIQEFKLDPGFGEVENFDEEKYWHVFFRGLTGELLSRSTHFMNPDYSCKILNTVFMEEHPNVYYVVVKTIKKADAEEKAKEVFNKQKESLAGLFGVQCSCSFVLDAMSILNNALWRENPPLEKQKILSARLDHLRNILTLMESADEETKS